MFISIIAAQGLNIRIYRNKYEYHILHTRQIPEILRLYNVDQSIIYNV